MLYRHKVGLIKGFNKKFSLMFLTLTVGAISWSSYISTSMPKPVQALSITNHVVINEIVANPNTGEIEWVELYNPTTSTVDMSGWRIRQNVSGNFSGVFASGTTIAPHGFLTRLKSASPALVNAGATLYLETGLNLVDVDTVIYPNLTSGQSYARTYDAETTFEVRNSSDVTKDQSNGSPPPLSFVPTDSSFIGSSRYVRSNHSMDLSAAVKVPAQTTQVRFNFTGTSSINNIAGIEHIQAGQWPTPAGEKQFRSYTSLPAGSFTVTAEFLVGDTWNPVTGSSIVYSIDQPWATYVIPTSSNQYFRPSDNPVRLRVDDQYYQFNYMVTEVNGNKYLVSRDQCDLRQAGNYLLCDVNNATAKTQNDTTYPAWPQLPAGTYTAKTTTYTKANNRADNVQSSEFIIDTQHPSLNNFVIRSAPEDYNSSISVQADATDNNGIKNVQFYITSPRVLDGKCDGNGTAINRVYGINATGSTYSASIDTSSLDGEYCLNAVAKDVATHSSQPILHIKVNL